MSTYPPYGSQPPGDGAAPGGWLPPSGAPAPYTQAQGAPAGYDAPVPGTGPQEGAAVGPGPWQQPPTAAPQPFAMGFAAAPKPGIIALRPLGIGDILDGAFQALRVNPRAMFVPALVVTAVIGAISAAVTYLVHSQVSSFLLGQDSFTAEGVGFMASSLTVNLGSLVSLPLLLFASAVLTGLLIVAVSRSVLGRVADLGETWERTKRRIPALLLQTLLISSLTGALVVAAFLAASLALVGLIPDLEHFFDTATPQSILVLFATFALLVLAATLVSLFLQIRLLVAPAALVLENVGVIESLKRSWQLTRGSFWRVLGTYLLVVILVGFVNSVLGGVVGAVQASTIFVSTDMSAFLSALASFLTPLFSGLTLPFQAAAFALVYIDLRIRKEGLDVELRKAAA